MNLKQKAYIGDSVYVQYDGRGIILTTENGYRDDPRNKIYMEPEVIEGFFSFVERIKALVKAEQDAKL